MSMLVRAPAGGFMLSDCCVDIVIYLCFLTHTGVLWPTGRANLHGYLDVRFRPPPSSPYMYTCTLSLLSLLLSMIIAFNVILFH